MSQETAPSKPLWYVAGLPGFADVTVMAQPVYEEVQFDYNGWPEDLIALGVMEPQWLTPTGKHLRDPDGGKVSVSRRWRVVSPEAPPRRYCVVNRRRPFAELARWPGALEALEAYRKCRCYYQTPQAPEPAKPSRPVLQLVVDNTQEVHP